jgi:ribonuclease D
MVPYDLIQRDEELARLIEHLRGAGCRRLAIDVEGENNLHRYGIHVALIQLFDGSRGYAVDPLAVSDRVLLASLLQRAPWELVWFDAGNDLLSFQHHLGIRPSPILDLSIAARMLDLKGGLSAVTKQGGSASAKDRLQKSNWMRRPLSRAMLDYAISDVLYLLPAADDLLAALERRGLAAEFRARNLEAQDAERVWNPLANYTRIPGFNRLPRPERRFAKVLWYAREYYGRERDWPPGNVASKLELRSILTKAIREPADMARFLNANRKRNLIDAVSLASCIRRAETDVDAEGRT